jgi:hypothetical protein
MDVEECRLEEKESLNMQVKWMKISSYKIHIIPTLPRDTTSILVVISVNIIDN